jgi:hypothetical protein
VDLLLAAELSLVNGRWKLRTGLVILVLLALAVYGEFLATSEPGPVRAYNQITLGMTLSEAEDAIGQPAGAYSTKRRMPWRVVQEAGLTWEEFWQSPDALHVPVRKVESWTWDSYRIWVAFRDGQIVACYLMVPDWLPFDRARHYLGL